MSRLFSDYINSTVVMFLVILFGLLLCAIPNFAANASSSSDVEDDSFYPPEHWSDSFDWQLFKAFSSSNYRNVLISPISLKLVLALLYEGASGVTEQEFRTALGFPLEKNQLRENFTEILKALKSTDRKEYILNLGTRIFLDSHVEPQQPYGAKAITNYETRIEPTNFLQPIEASKAINSWIDKVTNGKIPEMVKPDDVRNDIMLIGNAVYFKGTWRHQFPKNQTKTGGFYVSPTEVVEVSYMRTTSRFYYFESNDLDAKILRLPYRGRHYSLFIVLPNSKGGLSNLIKKINLDALKLQLIFLDPVPVEVSIPKFKFNFKTRYNQILKDFGLTQMFQNTASFPGIVRGRNLRLTVSNIVQKTGIELDEEGSVVYAATDVQFENKFGEAENVFNATHPFMFFIAEESQGTVLFVGKVENPLEMESVPLPPRFSEGEGNSNVSVAQPLANTPAPDLSPENPERDAIVSRFNYFDLELLKEFSESNGNVFISPANIKTLLALILEGARGKCAEELGNALRIEDIDRKDIREFLSRLLFDLRDRSENTLLETTSAIFVSNKFSILPEYQKKLMKFYRAEVKNVDFADAVVAAKLINAWTYNATRGIIPEIVGPGNLFEDTTILISNALFFKGKWKTAFDPDDTTTKCFHSQTRGCIQTPMMIVTETFYYNLDARLDAHAIELPYQDDKYAMLVLLPTVGNRISVLVSDMQHARFNDILSQMKPTEVILEMPRFEIEYNTELIPYLKQMKIQEVFGANANLTGIISQENIKISSIVHKTKIEVNEQGTRAAAASAAIVIPLMGSSTLRLSVDHPFIFFIYHKESRNIIFEGILMEPQDVGTSHPPRPPPKLVPTPAKTEPTRTTTTTQRVGGGVPHVYQANSYSYKRPSLQRT